MSEQVVTVYGKPGCVQCKYTCRELEINCIPFTYIDVTTNPVALQQVQEMGFTELPVVVAGDETWSGFRINKLRNMKWQLDKIH